MPISESDPFAFLSREMVIEIRKRLGRFFAGRGSKQVEDLVSETMVRLIAFLDRKEEARQCEPAQIMSVATRIAEYVMLESWRLIRRERAEEFDEEIASERNTGITMLESALVKEQCIELIRTVMAQALNQLSESEKEIIFLTELNPEGTVRLSELADMLGIEAATMRKRSSRAQWRFRKLLMSSERREDLRRCLGLHKVAAV